MTKHLASATLCLALTAGCSAQSNTPDVAVAIYKGCVTAIIRSTPPKLNTSHELISYAESLDHYCITWTGVWLPAMIPDVTLAGADLARFYKMRDATIKDTLVKLVKSNPSLINTAK